MRHTSHSNRSSEGRCLAPEDFYRFVSASAPESELSDLESHLADCSLCREELAGLLQLLHPAEMPDSLPEPSRQEIAEAMAIVRQSYHKENAAGRRGRPWAGWAAAAAVAAVVVGGTVWGLKSYQEVQRSNHFLAQAKAALEEVYAATSEGGLRLDLPFRSTATSRSDVPGEQLERSKTLFSQALAIRGDVIEAHLGLGAAYIGESQYSKARGAFQDVLKIQPFHPQALLGMGVAEFEEAIRSKDPLQRDDLLKKALADLDEVLERNPGSLEAQYNRIRILYETGRHTEALQEIDLYLSRDSQSIWAARLRELKIRIELSKTDAVEKTVEHAAASRDATTLGDMVRLVPDKAPGAIQAALRRSLEMDPSPAESGRPDSEDYRWAAEIMAEAYSGVTASKGYTQLVRFYDGLSPPSRATKRKLDATYRNLVDLYRQGKIENALAQSESIRRRYSDLQDSWQLLNLHHLRGSCFYYTAQFRKAELEYREMLRLAELIGSPDLLAMSLAAVGSALSEQRKMEEYLLLSQRLKQVAEEHNLDYWSAFASRNLGTTYLLLSRLEDSKEAYLEVLGPAYRLRDEGILVNTLENLGRIMDRLGRMRESREFLELALREQEAFSGENSNREDVASRTRRLNLLCELGELSLRMADLDHAETCFAESLEGARTGLRELQCRVNLGLARVYTERSKYDEAGRALEQVLQAAAAGNYTDLLWRAQLQKGKLLRRQGQTGAAIEYLEKAVQTSEKMGVLAPSGEYRQSFMTSMLEPFREIVGLLSHSGDRTLSVIEYVDRAKSAALRDYLGSHDLGSHFVEWVPKGGAQPEEALDCIVLEYFFSSDGALAIVSRKGWRHMVRLQSSPEWIEDSVGSYLRSVQSNDEAECDRLSRQLYDKLVGPALEPLGEDGTDLMVILPDGLLHQLPFAGLRDADGRYLLERYELAYAPSRSVLGYCLHHDRSDAALRDRKLMLLDGSANLPGAGDELAGLSRLYGKSARILESQDLAGAGRELRAAGIVHFAGHAVIRNGKPSLALRLGADRYHVSAGAISSWPLTNSRLVNLAGCSTGIGPQTDGETPWGLIPAFLNAGAPALVVSLLPLDDAATWRLNSSFYRLLAAGSVSKSRALQSAQLSILRELRSAGLSRPGHWIPFVLVGDPR